MVGKTYFFRVWGNPSGRTHTHTRYVARSSIKTSERFADRPTTREHSAPRARILPYRIAARACCPRVSPIAEWKQAAVVRPSTLRWFIIVGWFPSLSSVGFHHHRLWLSSSSLLAFIIIVVGFHHHRRSSHGIMIVDSRYLFWRDPLLFDWSSVAIIRSAVIRRLVITNICYSPLPYSDQTVSLVFM